MSRWSENLEMYWAHAVGTLLFAVVVCRYVALGQWEEFFGPVTVGTFGFFCVVASHEVADWTGRYGWSYSSFWTYPPNFVRFAGFVLLIGVNLFGF